MKQAVTLPATLGLGLALGYGISLLEAPQPRESARVTAPVTTALGAEEAPNARTAGDTQAHQAPGTTSERRHTGLGPATSDSATAPVTAAPGSEAALLVELVDRAGGEGAAPLYTSLVSAFVGHGDGAVAAALLAEGLDRWPNDLSLLHVGLAIDPARAQPVLEQLMLEDATAASILLQHWLYNDPPRALTLAKTVLTTQPTQWEALTALATLEPAALAQHYQAHGWDVFYEIGAIETVAEAMTQAGDGPGAAELYVRLLESEDYGDEGNWLIGELMEADPVAAQTYLRKALQQRPGDPSLLAAELLVLTEEAPTADAERLVGELLEGAISGDVLAELAYTLQDQSLDDTLSERRRQQLRERAWLVLRGALERNPHDMDLVDSTSEFAETEGALDFLIAQHEQRAAQGDRRAARRFGAAAVGAMCKLVEDDPTLATSIVARTAGLSLGGEELADLAEALVYAERVDLALPMFQRALTKDPTQNWIPERLAELR